MQQRALVLLALLAAPVAATAVSATSTAAAWLESHKSPTDDQLKELAGANPAAFAIVSALLSKHKNVAQLAPEERGPDVFRRMMGTPHLSVAEPRVVTPYASAELAEVSTPVVDQAHYDVNAASNRDESAVSRLLSAVASMGGSRGKKISALMKKRHTSNQETENALTADASLFAEEKPQPPPPAPIEEPLVQAAEVPHKKENSYLKGIDLTGDMPVFSGKHDAEKQSSDVKADDGADNLASFSFQDAAAQEITKPKPAPVEVEAPKPKKDSNVFLKWLGVVDKKPAPEEQPAAQPAKKQNSYLDSVKFFG